jgi:hypothetical protein
VPVTLGGVVAVGVATLLCAVSSGAAGPNSAAACRVPAGESPVARHGGVVVWEDPGVSEASSGSVYACSPRHAGRVKLLTFQYICGSPTGCGAQGGYTDVRFAGPWVAVAAGDPTPFGAVALWDTRGSPRARVVASWLVPDDFPSGPYGLALRADGALAYADQTVSNSGATLDVLHVCDSECPSVRRLARFVEPESYAGSRALLAGIRFAANGDLRWRDGDSPHTAHIP